MSWRLIRLAGTLCRCCRVPATVSKSPQNGLLESSKSQYHSVAVSELKQAGVLSSGLLLRQNGTRPPALQGVLSMLRHLLSTSTADSTAVPSPLQMVPVPSKLTAAATGSSAPVKERTAQAVLRKVRMSPIKLNLVAKLVRGMTVNEALMQLAFSPKRAAKTVTKVLKSAEANAVHNHGLVKERLVIDLAFVTKGRFLKRISIHGKGKSGQMVRKHSHITVKVREISEEAHQRVIKEELKREQNFKWRSRRVDAQRWMQELQSRAAERGVARLQSTAAQP